MLVFTGILPIIYSILLVIILISAGSQLRKNFKFQRFIVWFLCAAFILYCAVDPTVLAQVGAAIWKITVSIVSGIKIDSLGKSV